MKTEPLKYFRFQLTESTGMNLNVMVTQKIIIKYDPEFVKKLNIDESGFVYCNTELEASLLQKELKELFSEKKLQYTVIRITETLRTFNSKMEKFNYTNVLRKAISIYPKLEHKLFVPKQGSKNISKKSLINLDRKIYPPTGELEYYNIINATYYNKSGIRLERVDLEIK